MIEKDGFEVLENMLDPTSLKDLNDVCETLLPFVGSSKSRGWMNHEDVMSSDSIIDWEYYWSKTPEDNSFINDSMIPVLRFLGNRYFGHSDWDWQMTNRYIMSNYRHDHISTPHLDAPYLWPQMQNVQMAKSLPAGILSVTFMVPLTDFTVENGATGFIPGSHKYVFDTSNWSEFKPHLRTFFDDNYVQPEISLGSISCFYGNCMHSVMPNKTDVVRRGIIFRGIRNDALEEMERLGLG